MPLRNSNGARAECRSGPQGDYFAKVRRGPHPPCNTLTEQSPGMLAPGCTRPPVRAKDGVLTPDSPHWGTPVPVRTQRHQSPNHHCCGFTGARGEVPEPYDPKFSCSRAQAFETAGPAKCRGPRACYPGQGSKVYKQTKEGRWDPHLPTTSNCPHLLSSSNRGADSCATHDSRKLSTDP